MTELGLRAVGRARPDTVWLRYAHCRRWPDWSPYLLRVRADGDRIAPGTRGTVTSYLGVTACFVVESVDERRRTWTWRVRLGPLRLWLAHAVLPHPRGTETRLTVRGPGPVPFLYAPLARLALRRLVAPET
ncbi:SRPBCC family protein [Streptomyces sp. NPDC006997]|uniref:SRPBCC family protein n=1 Tax=Streptomyces sp. NPDC006997 TaxID=3155356 RepID=UPI00340E4DF9